MTVDIVEYEGLHTKYITVILMCVCITQGNTDYWQYSTPTQVIISTLSSLDQTCKRGGATV